MKREEEESYNYSATGPNPSTDAVAYILNQRPWLGISSEASILSSTLSPYLYLITGSRQLAFKIELYGMSKLSKVADTK
ncbi:hypothetical protein RHMOL_Rhmol09G0197500 [Rhododendron molle]|uniref:Uncharacterized protein n=1 Tax=Rhododendron molle TaxID=49168 RepID=A0ACC0MF08_RHOML|nr:hypothetical protein RHMOL_Rhmol09G0197500 [Rhododendron molle]